MDAHASFKTLQLAHELIAHALQATAACVSALPMGASPSLGFATSLQVRGVAANEMDTIAPGLARVKQEFAKLLGVDEHGMRA